MDHGLMEPASDNTKSVKHIVLFKFYSLNINEDKTISYINSCSTLSSSKASTKCK